MIRINTVLVQLMYVYVLCVQTPDPECLFTFHAGPIKGLDVSRKSHLMATTALDRESYTFVYLNTYIRTYAHYNRHCVCVCPCSPGSVKVFDFLAKRELTSSRFNQGGTAISWAPPLVSVSVAKMYHATTCDELTEN